MAHGDLLDSGRPAGGAYFATYLMLDHATQACAGPWIDTRGCHTMSVDVTGLVGGMIVLRGSNTFKAPVGDGHQVGAPLTGDGLARLHMPLRWVRADLVGAGYDSVTVILHALA